jgi:hypothetical protein
MRLSGFLMEILSRDCSRQEAPLQTLERSILQAVAYADVFDYPLTVQEIHRYLVGVRASLSAVQDALSDLGGVGRRLSQQQDYFTLPGREAIVETRMHRAHLATQMWPKAVRYGLSIASLPFVRMVGVTGTLAVNNVDADADIDYLIVTIPRRLWLARLFAIAFVYLGSLERLTICPNYVIALDALRQFDHSFFTAHELAQMVPLYGLDIYHELIRVNGWARCLLPNAFDNGTGARVVRTRPVSQALKRGLEFILAGKLGDIWEQRECRTKVHRLRVEAVRCGSNSAMFSSQLCKGHLGDHQSWITSAYAQRLKLVGLNAHDDQVTSQVHLGHHRACPDVERPD